MNKIIQPYGLHHASEAVGRTLAMINSRKEAVKKGTSIANVFGIPLIDAYVVTFWPGDVIFIIALPSNGKSFMARMHAKHILNTLMETEDDRAVVCVTLEESVEKVTAHWLAALAGVSSTDIVSGNISEVQMHYLDAHIAEFSTWPIYIIGHSISQRDKNDQRKQGARLTRGQIQKGLEHIMNNLGRDIAFVVIDYIQRVHPDDYDRNESHMRQTVDWIRDMALMCACPIEVCSQSRNEVLNKRYPIPGMGDGQWTSNIGQTGDTIFTSWFPKTTHGVGESIDRFAGFSIQEIEESDMFIRVAKQRDGPGGGTYLVKAKPHMLEWVRTDKYDLNDPKTWSNKKEEPEQKPIPF
jgi:replicative DNA helicase